jgi:hypothetical protein
LKSPKLAEPALVAEVWNSTPTLYILSFFSSNESDEILVPPTVPIGCSIGSDCSPLAEDT